MCPYYITYSLVISVLDFGYMNMVTYSGQMRRCTGLLWVWSVLEL